MDSHFPDPENGAPWPDLDARFPAAANWERFIDPDLPDGAFLPRPDAPRPAPSDEVRRQWTEWQDALLSGQCPAARPRMLVAAGRLPVRAPAFDPLAPWPELRRYCIAGWPLFVRWLRAFRLTLAAQAPTLPGGLPAEAVRAMDPGRVARIRVVGLADPAVLSERPGDATITLAFLTSAGYPPWLKSFASAAPPRRAKSGWFTGTPALVPPPADIGGHRVRARATARAAWLAFADPGVADTDLAACPAGRPEPGDRLRAEWAEWAEWAARRAGQSGGAGESDGTEGERPDGGPRPDSAPRFADLAPWPAVRAHARATWPCFEAWFPRAQRHAEAAARTAALRIADLHALHPKWSKASLRTDVIEVAPLHTARVLYEAPGRAVVAAGLVASPEFADWALAFTADRAVGRSAERSRGSSANQAAEHARERATGLHRGLLWGRSGDGGGGTGETEGAGGSGEEDGPEGGEGGEGTEGGSA